MAKNRPAAFAAAAAAASGGGSSKDEEEDDEPEETTAAIKRRPKRQRVGAATPVTTAVTSPAPPKASTTIPPFGYISLEDHERILNMAKKRHAKELSQVKDYLHKEQEKTLKEKDQALQKAVKFEKLLQASREKLKEERKKKTPDTKKVQRLPFFNQAANINHVTDVANTEENETTADTTTITKTTAIQPNKIDVRWQVKYDLLRAFKTEFGHTNCNHHGDPALKTNYPGLATWVSTQRTAFTWLKAGKKTTLTPHRIHLLNQIGFDWQPLKTDFVHFEQRIPQLQAYKDAFGHTNVPQNYKSKEAPGLGNWVLAMRRKYRMGVLAPHRVELLEQMGFVWKLRNRGGGGGGGGGATTTTTTARSPAATSPIRLPPVRVPRGSPWNRYNV